MKISVCIPAYNRVKYLSAVLDSVLSQSEDLHELVICEDRSPERAQIRAVVSGYAQKFGAKISYHENPENVGFDGNIRQLLLKATGDYCLFLGNDDLLAPGALRTAADFLRRHPDVGVLIRAYEWFEGDSSNVTGKVSYYKTEQVFPRGLNAIGFGFRRSCVLAGLVLKRAPAVAVATTRFDGTLFYQLHIAGNLLASHDCGYVPTVLAQCRADEVPEFGNASAEKGDYTPGEYTINARLKMMRGITEIANSLDATTPGASERILRDLAIYSYPWLAYHGDKKPEIFKSYYEQLGAMGLGRHSIFHLYYAVLRLTGPSLPNKTVAFLRRVLGSTPQLGRK